MGRRRAGFDVYALASQVPEERANAVRCRRCPVYEKFWCKVLAKVVKPTQPACEYGKKLITYEKRNERRHDGHDQD